MEDEDQHSSLPSDPHVHAEIHTHTHTYTQTSFTDIPNIKYFLSLPRDIHQW